MISEEDVVDGGDGTLNLSMRGWRTLNESQFDLKARRVRLEHNNLTLLPPCIGKLSLMMTLDVSHNNLESLPVELGYCTRLQSLNCENNHLTSLPKELGNCAYLQEIRANFNRLTTVPETLGNLLVLKVLELRHNRLISLPYQIGGLEVLETLDCADNDDLDMVPHELRDDSDMVQFVARLHYQTMQHTLRVKTQYHEVQSKLIEAEERNLRLRDAIDIITREKARLLSSASFRICSLM